MNRMKKIPKQTRRSGGPRTKAGKAKSSRNALKHGFATRLKADPLLLRQSKGLALAICGEAYTNKKLLAQALVVAECELIVQQISEQKLILIERLQDPFTIPIAKDTMSNRKRLLDYLCEQSDLAHDAAEQLCTKLKTQGEEALTQQDMALTEKWSLEGRDEFEAIREAMTDLDRLGRYERRAWSRRHRAMREFIAIMALTENDPVNTKETVSSDLISCR